MCPYLGLEETGSPFTGERDSDCETDCGWFQDGICIAGSDLSAAFGERLEGEFDPDELAEMEWPACEYASECKWQDQAPDGVPCAPRMLLLLGENPEKALF